MCKKSVNLNYKKKVKIKYKFVKRLIGKPGRPVNTMFDYFPNDAYLHKMICVSFGSQLISMK